MGLKRGEIQRLREHVALLKNIGGQMANMCFNGAQQDSIPADYRKTMTELRLKWDNAARDYSRTP